MTLPIVTNAGDCARDENNPLLTYSSYTNTNHYGYTAVVVRPLKRVSADMGYSITRSGGATTQFNSLQPLGSLAYIYHQPLARVSLDLGHNLGWNAGYNYYQYREESFTGPTSSRYFHANNVTFSLSYGF
jgi:hypothetical protein